jgi:deoxyadenosine/deoxycytidine kinase
VGDAREIPYVAIAGNIAVGKSQLVRSLASALGAEYLPEDIDRNPYFNRFYQDPSSWAFHSQTAFVLDALHRQETAPPDRPLVQDRTAYESIDVFGRVLHTAGHLTDSDLATFERFRDVALALPRQPNLMIYLHAPTEVIMERIADRNRPAELRITRSYIDSLNTEYARFADRWDICPLLRLDAHGHDLRTPDSVEQLASLINQV